MRYLILLLLLIVTSLGCFAQGKVVYTYDAAGNRESRYVDLTKSAQISDNTDGWNDPFIDMMGEQKIKIYPNPTKGRLKLEIPMELHESIKSIHVFDMNGKELIRKNKPGPLVEINLQSYADGIYLLKIYSTSETREWKIKKH